MAISVLSYVPVPYAWMNPDSGGHVAEIPFVGGGGFPHKWCHVLKAGKCKLCLSCHFIRKDYPRNIRDVLIVVHAFTR